MSWWQRLKLWWVTPVHPAEGLPVIALDCGHESGYYAQSSRTGRTACFRCYHDAIAPRGSRVF